MNVKPLQAHNGRVMAIKVDDRKSMQEARRIALKERLLEELEKPDGDLKAVLATIVGMI